jgi:uncharacterized protein YdhG (YjbR/CyaY superfamily)
MKKLYPLFLFFLCTNYVIYGQAKITIQKNMILHYEVKTDDGETYPFDVTIDKFSATGIKFNWTMKSDKSMKGSVTIYKAALETAQAYRNYFANNSNVKLTKETTVWISKKNYTELLATKATKLSLDFSLQDFVYINDKTYTTTLNSKKINLSSIVVKSTTTENNITILKDATNPLILVMQPKDFIISLKSIDQK